MLVTYGYQDNRLFRVLEILSSSCGVSSTADSPSQKSYFLFAEENDNNDF